MPSAEPEYHFILPFIDYVLSLFVVAIACNFIINLKYVL